MNTYTPTPTQVLSLLESGYCHADVPQTDARPADGQNVIVCDRTCHVVSVVDQMHTDLMRVYLRRGLSNGTYVSASHMHHIGGHSGGDQLGKQGAHCEQI